ncbi:MAG: TrmH family RNA methyltransferase, partial [Flavobacteriaceae bacterium]|nr:TrmH family RNA methyltransferase [Flavobacteriaceae bacterium]
MPDEKLLSYLSGFISENRFNKIKSIAANRTYHFTVAIEDVYQLHNTSAVIRTCDVFGIQEVNVIEARNRKKIDREIAMGAQKWVDILRHNDSSSCMAAVRNKGYRVVAASPHEHDINLSQLDISKKTCFF